MRGRDLVVCVGLLLCAAGGATAVFASAESKRIDDCETTSLCSHADLPDRRAHAQLVTGGANLFLAAGAATLVAGLIPAIPRFAGTVQR